MSADFKQLRLADIILNRRGTLTFRLILAAFGTALRLFFRRIETVNADRVPDKGGVIFVMNHPNGLIDPHWFSSHFRGRSLSSQNPRSSECL